MGWLKAVLDGFADSFDIDAAPWEKPTPHADRDPVPPLNDAEAYGVKVEPVKVASGQWYWRVVKVHHLAPQENNGNHHIYLDVLDPALPDEANVLGGRVFGARLKVTWDGGESIATVEKPLGEPGGNFPMWKSQDCAVAALGLEGHELPSDRVTGLHIRHPDEAPGNTWGHHSFSVLFVRSQAPVRASSVISGRARRGAGRTVVLTRDNVDVARQAVAGDETYRFAGLSAGAYRVAVANTAIVLPPLAVDGADSVTADLDLPSDGKPIAHYVLFGPAEQPSTAVMLLLAQEYLLTFRPAFGFNPIEAAGASTVTVIANEKAVGSQIVADLTAAGATVNRISGTAAEVAAALAERMPRK